MLALQSAVSMESNHGRIGYLTISLNDKTIMLDSCRTYLVFDEKQTKIHRIAESVLNLKKKVMFISRLHPDLIREKIIGEIAEAIWLSERPGERSVSPQQLGRLLQRITTFVKKESSAVVFLDGLEYLSLFNDFQRLQMFVEHLNDITMESRAILVVAVDPRLFDQRSLAKLRRFAEIVS
ncbi:MAG: DUF835 domain-containing protein [Methanomassiliicoccales archaeon]